MSSFTPGPWVVQARKGNRICGPEGVIVAEAWYPPARLKREAKQAAFEQGRANARLIAAAPDMLDVLREARDRTLETAEATGLHRPALIHRIDAAISRATGEPS